MTTYSGNDIYCDLIIPKKIDLDIIHETDQVMVFYHTKPAYELHIVVVPKEHVDDITTLKLSSASIAELLITVQETADEVRKAEGKARIITNLGEYQDSKHLHFHVVSGKRLGG